MSETKKKISWKFLGILGGLAIAVAGGAYIYHKFILGEALTPLDAAKLVPDKALMATYISNDQETLSKIKEFGTPEAQKILSEGFTDLFPNITEDSDINYNDDIKPWLGNIMFAILPETEGKENDNVLMVIGITNKLKALEFSKKSEELLKDLEKITYKDYSISNGITEEDDSLSFALVNDYLVVASEEEGIKSSIDSFQGENSLANQMKKEDLVNQSLSLKNPLAQIYFPNYSNFMEVFLEEVEKATSEEDLEDLEEIPEDFYEELFAQLQNIDSLMIGVGLEEEGFHFQGITQFSDDFDLSYLQATDSKVLNEFPSETFLLVTGKGINKIWSSTVKELEKVPVVKDYLDEGRQAFKEELNLDLDKDIFGWLDQEFAFGMIHSTEGSLGMFGVGGALALETSDRTTGENTINTLMDFFEPELSPYIVSSETKIEDINVTQWKTPFQEEIVGFGWKEKDLFLMTFGTSFGNFMRLNKEESLVKSENFKAITQSLPKDNLGYFYFDMKPVRSILQSISQLTGEGIPIEAQAFLDSFKGVAMTSTLPQDNITQVDMIFSLEKVEK